MKLKRALEHGRKLLASASIAESHLEGELLLREALELNRTELYLELENDITPQQETSYLKLLKRRLSGEPSAYILKRREFYGLEFYVDDRVLIPRPETELLVEKALELVRNYSNPIIADIGCGSGAIAVTLALKLPEAAIYAIDISAAALEVAHFNLARHGVTDRVTLLEGDLATPLAEKADIIVANLPYLKEEEATRNVSEPSSALSGGASGTGQMKRLCAQAGDKLNKGGVLLLEIGYGQAESMVSYIREVMPVAVVTVSRDLAGIERIIAAVLPPKCHLTKFIPDA